MVAYICTLPTLEERNQHAQVVIDLMGFLNPHLRDVADFKHKLWDHLHIISDFKIEVDSPYPKPEPGALHARPKALGYPQRRIRYKHYGKTVEMMIERAKAIEEPERKQQMIQAIANFMKIAYVTWNKDTVADETIISDLKDMSNGELVWQENMNLSKVDIRQQAVPTNQNNNRQRNNNQNSGQNKNRNNRNNNQSGGNGNNRSRNNNQGKRF